MISYAQNGEDVILNRVFAGQASGFYVDVGAWDPDLHSVTKHFYVNGWRGINIEPTDFYYARLERARPDDVNLKVAIGTGGPRARFVEHADTGLSGFVETAERTIAETASLGVAVKEIEVDVMPLSEVMRLHVRGDIDFLKIDVEGAERSVIESADWRGFRPRVLLVEAIAPVSNEPTWFQWEGLLFDAGYSFALFDGINRYYYRAEEPELRPKLSVPANVLDNFVTIEVMSLLDEVRSLKGAAHIAKKNGSSAAET